MERHSMTTASLNRRSRGLVKPMVAAGCLMFALSGCKLIDKPIIVGSVPDDYRRTHPIAIDESLETMDIPVGLNTGRLSKAMKGNVNGFAQRFVDSGSAVIAVVSPSGSPNATVAAYVSYEIQDVLVASGVSPKAIDHRLYKAESGENSAPVRIAFARIAAKTAPCGPWPDQIANNPENRNYHNFGCATQTNLAAMTANPLDLMYPRGMTPPDAARRAVVLEKYRNGEAYQTDYSRESSQNIAEGVGE
jgi:pilus assembly protein CpaD